MRQAAALAQAVGSNVGSNREPPARHRAAGRGTALPHALARAHTCSGLYDKVACDDMAPANYQVAWHMPAKHGGYGTRATVAGPRAKARLASLTTPV